MYYSFEIKQLERFTIHFATINTLVFSSLFCYNNIFTIHFATINTIGTISSIKVTGEFTIHFATINTYTSFCYFNQFFTFTIHFATINTNIESQIRETILYLQYTLLLLIQLLISLEPV